jgi:excisionase family DNA binding protein
MNKKIFFEASVSEVGNLVAEQVRAILRQELNALKSSNNRQGTKYLTTTEACAKLRISRSTLYRLVQQGNLQCKKVGRRSLYNVSDLEAVVKLLNV